ncbi:MAG: M23 family metallopeptidase [Gammaproteobacteria bacterium]
MSTKSYVLACIALLVVACGGSDSGPSNAEIQAQIAKEANDFCEGKTFRKPEESPYVLPWLPGATYKMFQGNCSNLGGHKDRFAYDFDLNMGDPVFASLSGTVDVVIDTFSDNDHIEGHENRVNILHDNGRLMWYVHLMQGSAVVIKGQRVQRGDMLGLAGNSGNSASPHLHVQLFRDNTDFSPNRTLPISYNNVDGLTRPSGELIEGQSYTAKPFAVFDE